MSSAAEILASQLADARRNRRTSAPFPSSAITTMEDAYALQDIATTIYGRRNGYKIGATSPAAQRIMNCDGPFFGPMFAEDSHRSGEAIVIDETMLAVECEFAFRIGPISRPFVGGETAESIASVIESCHPAIEIVGRRVASEGFPAIVDAISDFGLNARFVVGDEIPDWEALDLAGSEVRALVDGTETNAGSGAQVYGHPLAALAWLANALTAQGKSLEEGDWVSTGTCLGIVPIRADSEVVADFGPLGSVSVEFLGRK
ncbi:MAG: hypothetical protein C0606_16430 [Hyphomicrobiales bacterium]|nr:MAG: hypothetical protein C0606_16430 [Hyphomicrobiales bacterium]